MCGTGTWDQCRVPVLVLVGFCVMLAANNGAFFFSGSSMEMCNPDMAASGRIITAPLGRTAGMGRHKGRWGSSHSVTDLPLCPSAPASHNAARDI